MPLTRILRRNRMMVVHTEVASVATHSSEARATWLLAPSGATRRFRRPSKQVFPSARFAPSATSQGNDMRTSPAPSATTLNYAKLAWEVVPSLQHAVLDNGSSQSVAFAASVRSKL
eukprot:scaffold1187_cov258-Pinguiococcus_pyrenoidosus.AAC.21